MFSWSLIISFAISVANTAASEKLSPYGCGWRWLLRAGSWYLMCHCSEDEYFTSGGVCKWTLVISREKSFQLTHGDHSSCRNTGNDSFLPVFVVTKIISYHNNVPLMTTGMNTLFMIDNRPRLVYFCSSWLTLKVNSYIFVFHNIHKLRCTGMVANQK